MRTLKLNELEGHDAIEFSIFERPRRYWKESSIFIMDDDMSELSKIIIKFVPHFDYYGLTIIYFDEWYNIYQDAKNDFNAKNDIESLEHIEILNNWMQDAFSKYNCIEIFGV